MHALQYKILPLIFFKEQVFSTLLRLIILEQKTLINL